MKKIVSFIPLLFAFLFGIGQSNFYTEFDTIALGCSPGSNLLNVFTDSANSSDYTYDTIPYYTEPVGGTNVAMFDDQVLGPFNIGFDFNFYCGQFTQFYICSNGWIGFSAGQTQTWVVQSIPNVAANTPKNTIMGPWRDWRPTTNIQYITYQTTGVAPNRKLVVTWNAVPMFSCVANLGTFQIVLHESSNIIHNNLTNVPVCLAWGGGDGTNGVHNDDGTKATAVNGRNDSQFTVTNESVRFIPTSPITWTLPNGDTLGIGNQVEYLATQSTYVYANGVTCDNDTVIDSTYIQYSAIEVMLDSQNVDCTNDSTGFLVATDTSTQTSAPFTFFWVDGANDTIATHQSINDVDTLFDIPAGSYTVYARDDNGLIACNSATISQPDSIIGILSSSEDVLCFGDTTGIAMAIDSNDYTGLNWDGFYNYYWSEGGNLFDSTLLSTSDTNSLVNVGAGTYNVTIDGCLISTGSVTVNEPSLMAASISNPTAVSCPEALACDASALGSGAGGVTPYTYAWSNGETTPLAVSLCQDTNWLTVTDANGCDSTAYIIIGVPDSIETFGFTDTLICKTNFAALTASSTGGTGPFDYIWMQDSIGGDTIAFSAATSVQPLKKTEYFVSSTDVNGCPGDTASVTIKVRPDLGVILPNIDTICPYDTIDITVQGTGGDSLYSFAWSNGDFGPTITVSPDLSTWYVVTVADVCGTPAYTDSVFVQVGGYPRIQAHIELEEDSVCAGKSLYLIASGQGGWRGPDEYRFTWNKTNWSGNPIQFDRPLKTTEYIVSITDLCLSPAGADTVTIHVGTPEIPVIEATPTEACSYAEVQFFSLNPFQSGYDFNWNFGDGAAAFNSQTDSVVHSYSEPGCYDVTLEVATVFGCSASVTEECMIQILESPIADLSYLPSIPTTLEPIVIFSDESIGAESIDWFIDNDYWGMDSAFQYEFLDTGYYEVRLIAQSVDGCLDTTDVLIHFTEGQTVFIPKSFSPDGDGLNDVFQIRGDAISSQGFEFIVLDRWGHKIFYTKNPSFGWDGRRISNGEFVNTGSYPFLLNYTDLNGELRKEAGQIIVVKTGSPTGLR